MRRQLHHACLAVGVATGDGETGFDQFLLVVGVEPEVAVVLLVGSGSSRTRQRPSIPASSRTSIVLPTSEQLSGVTNRRDA